MDPEPSKTVHRATHNARGTHATLTLLRGDFGWRRWSRWSMRHFGTLSIAETGGQSWEYPKAETKAKEFWKDI